MGDVKRPTLAELTSGPCSLDQLQAAIIELIRLHNQLDRKITAHENGGRIRSERETIMNTPYGL